MIPKSSMFPRDMLSFANLPKVYFGGSSVGQNPDLNQSKEFSLGKILPVNTFCSWNVVG
jgi:hypothetical protein